MTDIAADLEPDPDRSGREIVDTTPNSTKHSAAARFGKGARPSAILLTHGHFDHVGALEELAAEWEVPVYAHRIEHAYLDGSAAYPPGDPKVGGGLMAVLSPLYPTKPVNVSDYLQALPEDGLCRRCRAGAGSTRPAIRLATYHYGARATVP